jgi:hypothetical protein
MKIKIKMKKTWILIVGILATQSLSAKAPDDYKKEPPTGGTNTSGNTVSQRPGGDCAQGTSRFDMDINNVRAALLSSGDVWWDLNMAQYVVPKVQPGTGAKAVSSLFAGAVWLGGKDPGKNLKVAVQTYRTGVKTDFWPGPLTDRDGTTELKVCDRWDKHFVVYGSEIEKHIKAFQAAKVAGTPYNAADLGQNIKGWPSLGNPYFLQINGFELPTARQGLAKFYDEDGDGRYNPLKGDYPVIDVRGCTAPQYPDQMVFWIYNDNGGVHTQSARSLPIQMEVQVQAFAYKTNDALNDMTFQRYKLINRAVQDIDSTYFAMWTDPDLGCPDDDFVGCDTTRNLAYVYNLDATDGTAPGSTVCNQGINTYGDKIPILGIDYFRGPLDENGREIGMTAFTYYGNAASAGILPGMTDPNTAVEYYNYLTGRWKDGTPFTFGGSGYNPGGGRPIAFAFPDGPNKGGASWSMCTAGLGNVDRRTIQASGPFKLKPGAVNELIIGVPWVADQKYPCPDITQLQRADDLAQNLFDACFAIQNGPDAPDISFIELDQEIIAVLSNNPLTSNNPDEAQKEKGLKIPRDPRITDTVYRFQGYKLYQVANADVGNADLEDATKSRLIAQVDIKDTVSTIYNWKGLPNPNFPGLYTDFYAEEKVTGENKGIRHTFRLKKDLFATGTGALVNHKKYYYVAIAYAYNNYQKFNSKAAGGDGQEQPYFVGRRNIGQSATGKPYVCIPRPITDVALQAKYGDGPIVTRLDGLGTGGNFIDLSEETLQKILARTAGSAPINELTYKPAAAPIDVKIYNPLEVTDGTYELYLKDSDMTDNVVEDAAKWVLKHVEKGTITTARKTIADLNEQILSQYGFTIAIGQVPDAGVNPVVNASNGAVGSSITYASGKPWLTGVKDDDTSPDQFLIANPDVINYMKTGLNEADFNLDPKRAYQSLNNLFTPFILADYRPNTSQPLITPAWVSTSANLVRAGNNGLFNLNNVDIVFTKDKSKWSRCVVVETSSPNYYDRTALNAATEGGALNFELRKHASVGKEDANNDGLPDADNQGLGMGWFPGYAVDVESGKRLNIFFGENSSYDENSLIGNYLPESVGLGRDMMWKPSSQFGLTQRTGFNFQTFCYAGGQHYIYVTSQEYDECADLRAKFSLSSPFAKLPAFKSITWTAMPYVAAGQKMLSYKEGLIPNDVTVKLRVNNPYQVATASGKNGGHPTYKFEIKAKAPKALDAVGVENELDMMNVVPNPYYARSDYEINQFNTTVKITNLPAKATVTVYSLDGKFIRDFKRDEVPELNPVETNQGIRTKQIMPDLQWDLKNHKGIPVASGAYLINVVAPGLGERTLKLMVINREFDPSRL